MKLSVMARPLYVGEVLDPCPVHATLQRAPHIIEGMQFEQRECGVSTKNNTLPLVKPFWLFHQQRRSRASHFGHDLVWFPLFSAILVMKTGWALDVLRPELGQSKWLEIIPRMECGWRVFRSSLYPRCCRCLGWGQITHCLTCLVTMSFRVFLVQAVYESGLQSAGLYYTVCWPRYT